jgi:hypothetical protein
VASDGHAVLAAWERGAIEAARIRSDGTVLDLASIVVTESAGTGLAAASNGTTFLVVWAGGGAIVADDSTAPTVFVPRSVSVAATSVNGSAAEFSASAYDAVSGVLIPTCSPASGSHFPLGSSRVTCTVSDWAGNVGEAHFDVEVKFSWSGMLPPIDPAGRSVVKRGRVVPAKFQLTGASSRISDLKAYLTVMNVRDGTVKAATSASSADRGNVFRFDPDTWQYVFNLETAGLGAGSWQAKIEMNDGVERIVRFTIVP